jgi:hypothetical protein
MGTSPYREAGCSTRVARRWDGRRVLAVGFRAVVMLAAASLVCAFSLSIGRPSVKQTRFSPPGIVMPLHGGAFERDANAALHDKSDAPRPACTCATGDPLCSCIR